MIRILALSIVAALMLVAPAHAGPVAGAIAWIGAAMKTSFIVSALVNVATSMALSAIASKLGKKPNTSSQASRREVKFDISMGDDVPLSLVLGKYATAGTLKHIGTWGKNTRFITQILELSAMPLGGIDDIWVNEERGQILRDRIGLVSGLPYDVEDIQDAAAGAAGISLGHPVIISSNGDRRLIWVKFKDGNQTQADDFAVYAMGANQYPWSGIGYGKAYAIITIQYDEEWQSSRPNFLFSPTPMALYDPRKDSTVGGSGAHRWGQPATYESTTNLAVISYNVARGLYWGSEWVFGGKNLPAWRLPLPEWFAAMNACDRMIGDNPAYRGGFEISVDDVPADVLEEFGRAGNLRFAEVGGMLKPCVDLPASSVFTITDDDILITEGQSYQPFNPISDTFNTLNATYPEPAEKWISKDAPQRIDAEGMAADGGRFLPTSTTYSACPFVEQVQRLMRSQLLEYRRMRQHSFTLGPEAFALEPLDMITFTSARNGYINKKFIVEDVRKIAGYNIPVTLKEVDPSDYSWDSDMELPVVITEPVNPVKFAQTITGFAAIPVVLYDDSGRGRISGIQVSCNAGEVGIEEIRIQVYENGALIFDFARPYVEPCIWTITGVAPETTYQVRAALVSSITGRFTWSGLINVTTLAELIWLDQLSEEIRLEFEQIAAEGGIKIVETLPASGDFPDQVVMLRSDKSFYRWDGPTLQWSTSVYAGVADSSITAAKIVSDNILSRHIASSNILATHIAVGQITADKMNVGALSAISANVGILRTATSGARQEIHSDMILIYDEGGTLRVRLGRLS